MQTNPLGLIKDVARFEAACWVGFITVLIFLTVGANWLDDLSNTAWFALLFVWLCGVILWAAFGVTRHADCLAIMLGGPYGTVILTVAVTGMEVIMIVAVAVTGVLVASLLSGEGGNRPRRRGTRASDGDPVDLGDHGCRRSNESPAGLRPPDIVCCVPGGDLRLSLLGIDLGKEECSGQARNRR